MADLAFRASAGRRARKGQDGQGCDLDGWDGGIVAQVCINVATLTILAFASTATRSSARKARSAIVGALLLLP